MFQLLKCRAADVDGVEDWLKGANYLSHDIVNEMVEIMALNLLRKLLVEIRHSDFFPLLLMKLVMQVAWSNCVFQLCGLMNRMLYTKILLA